MKRGKTCNHLPVRFFDTSGQTARKQFQISCKMGPNFHSTSTSKIERYDGFLSRNPRIFVTNHPAKPYGVLSCSSSFGEGRMASDREEFSAPNLRRSTRSSLVVGRCNLCRFGQSNRPDLRSPTIGTTFGDLLVLQIVCCSRCLLYYSGRASRRGRERESYVVLREGKRKPRPLPEGCVCVCGTIPSLPANLPELRPTSPLYMTSPRQRLRGR